MITIPVNKNPYDTAKNLFSYKELSISSGFNTLVGCNGSGKTTLLKNIRDYCKENDIPVMHLDNYFDNSPQNTMEELTIGKRKDTARVLNNLLFHSEGETMANNFRFLAEDMGSFMFQNKSAEKIVFLFDAFDSGLSIDRLAEIKDFLAWLMEEEKRDIDIYIVFSANGYELTLFSRCIDVSSGKEVNFKDYSEYRAFVIKTRKKIDKSYGK